MCPTTYYLTFINFPHPFENEKSIVIEYQPERGDIIRFLWLRTPDETFVTVTCYNEETVHSFTTMKLAELGYTYEPLFSKSFGSHKQLTRHYDMFLIFLKLRNRKILQSKTRRQEQFLEE